jgi:hypothetical protein
MTIKYFYRLIVLAFLFFYSPCGYAQDTEDSKTKADYPWAVSLYGGVYTDDGLVDVFSLAANWVNDNNVVVAALSREIYRYKQYLSFEIEGQIGRHFGDDVSHWELVGLGLGRWHPFPWDDIVDTSFAVGAGLSYYSEISQVEKDEDDDARRLLGYLAFELTFGLPRYPRWDLMLRIHHRSGMGGVIGDGSSNYGCIGLKYAF